MVTPFSKFQKIEDIVPLMDKEERLLYPLVDNTIMVLNKIINPTRNMYLCLIKMKQLLLPYI